MRPSDCLNRLHCNALFGLLLFASPVSVTTALGQTSPSKSAEPVTKAPPAPSKDIAPKAPPKIQATVEPKLGPAKVPSKPGLWETKILTELSNGSTGEGGSQICVLPRDLRAPEVLLPTYSEVGMSCANKDFKLSGATATWRIVCSGKGGTAEGKGTLTFTAESQQGSAKIEKLSSGKSVTLKQKITAKLTGPCG